MDFRKKMKIILYSSVVMLVLGVILAFVLAFTGNGNDILVLIGIILFLAGGSIISYYVKDIERNGGVETYVTEKLDERNVMIKTKAKSITFSICCPLFLVLCYGLRIVDVEWTMDVAKMLGTIGWVMVFIYEISLAILKKKY